MTPAINATTARTSAAVHPPRTRRPLGVRVRPSVIGTAVAIMKSLFDLGPRERRVGAANRVSRNSVS